MLDIQFHLDDVSSLCKLKIDFPSLDSYPDYKHVTNLHKYFIVKQ